MPSRAVPKPAPDDREPFIPSLEFHQLMDFLGSLAPDERKALTQIAEEADLLEVEGRAWLVVPASGWLVDTLAAVNAASEDMEPHMEDEDTHDREHDSSDEEPDTDAEQCFGPGPRMVAAFRRRTGAPTNPPPQEYRWIDEETGIWKVYRET